MAFSGSQSSVPITGFTGLTRLQQDAAALMDSGRLTQCLNAYCKGGMIYRMGKWWSGLLSSVFDTYDTYIIGAWNESVDLPVGYWGSTSSLGKTNSPSETIVLAGHVFKMRFVAPSGYTVTKALGNQVSGTPGIVPVGYPANGVLSPVYSEGSVDVVNGSKHITTTAGQVTSWRQNVHAGDVIQFRVGANQYTYLIKTVHNDEWIELDANYTGADASPVSYWIYQRMQHSDDTVPWHNAYDTRNGYYWEYFSTCKVPYVSNGGYGSGLGYLGTTTIFITGDSPLTKLRHSVAPTDYSYNTYQPLWNMCCLAATLGGSTTIPDDSQGVNSADGTEHSVEGARAMLWYHDYLLLFGTKEYLLDRTVACTLPALDTVSSVDMTSMSFIPHEGDQFVPHANHGKIYQVTSSIYTGGGAYTCALDRNYGSWDSTNEPTGAQTIYFKHLVKHRYRIRWSNWRTFDSWDWSSAGDTAGYTDGLGEQMQGNIIDAKIVGDVIYILLTTGIATMRYTGGEYNPFDLAIHTTGLDVYEKQRMIEADGELYFWTNGGTLMKISGGGVQIVPCCDRTDWRFLRYKQDQYGSTTTDDAAENDIPPYPPEYGIQSCYDSMNNILYFIFNCLQGTSYSTHIYGYCNRDNTWFEVSNVYPYISATHNNTFCTYASSLYNINGTWTVGTWYMDYPYRNNMDLRLPCFFVSSPLPVSSHNYICIPNIPENVLVEPSFFTQTWVEPKITTPWYEWQGENTKLGNLGVFYAPEDSNGYETMEYRLETRGVDGTLGYEPSATTYNPLLIHNTHAGGKSCYMFRLKFRQQVGSSCTVGANTGVNCNNIWRGFSGGVMRKRGEPQGGV